MNDEKLWRERFLGLAIVRVTGLALMALGLVVQLTDFVRPGGAPVVAAALMVVGATDALIIPRLLKARWSKP